MKEAIIGFLTGTILTMFIAADAFSEWRPILEDENGLYVSYKTKVYRLSDLTNNKNE